VITGRHRFISGAVIALMLALALPALANASGSWVSKSAVGTNESCASPGFNSVQAAIEAAGPGATIRVCGGTYTEQLEITKPVKIEHVVGENRATIAMPGTPADSLTSCDTAPGLEAGQKDEISICTSGKVSLTSLHIEAVAPIETCAGGLYGIFVAGGAELTAKFDTIIGASTSLDAFKGCQHGVAVEVGSAKAEEVGHAILKEDAVSGYEKNGPTVAWTGSTLKVLNSAVTGAGPTPFIAQNGIEVAFGGKGVIKGTNVLENECDVAEVCGASNLEEQASGVLFFGAAAGSLVNSSTIASNDLGIYFASTNPAQASSPEVKMSGNHLTSNRDEGIVLEQGDASLVEDTITGAGDVGVDIVQSASQPYASDATASSLTIEGQSVAGIGVLSDGLPGDPSGSFSIKNSSISKNAAAISDPSATFQVKTKNVS
jgi:nitrous oxidase accessory protein NosD